MSDSKTTPQGKTAFFYGTLMSRKVLSRVIYGTSTPEKWQCAHLRIRPAILHGYYRRQVRYVDYPGITPQHGMSVRGTYVEGLTEGDVWRLDQFEGSEYERRKVAVRLLEGEPKKEGEEVETETYVFVAPETHLENKEWDYNFFVEEKLNFWCGEESREFSDVDGDYDSTGGRYNFVSEFTSEEKETWKLEPERCTQEKA
ncbi:hypothetical protein RUND412_003407 [Rhizina undulata]